ncbi:hypothetical protein SLEP1_g49831 [Rubroshorea leprosula]|uniref:Uncharacterized protein n=1 Tax=Rubroshorea leprosula TaxID=152421 RepID=A0AAV5M0C0_9ROSI|nr:hypothetical protein SLEP1_g49831 [Rubroshorea leprosula]
MVSLLLWQRKASAFGISRILQVLVLAYIPRSIL